MRNATLTTREFLMITVLLVLLIAVVYYMGFYAPLQEELSAVSGQIFDLETQISNSASKISAMNTMQAELDAVFSRPGSQISEIAPYDNKQVVLNQLNGILRHSLEYSLHFSEPSIQENGTVRRNVIMQFRCADYASAKGIIQNLTNSHWRCLVSNLSITASGDIMHGPVEVDATVTFFESTNLNG